MDHFAQHRERGVVIIFLPYHGKMKRIGVEVLFRNPEYIPAGHPVDIIKISLQVIRWIFQETEPRRFNIHPSEIFVSVFLVPGSFLLVVR